MAMSFLRSLRVILSIHLSVIDIKKKNLALVRTWIILIIKLKIWSFFFKSRPLSYENYLVADTQKTYAGYKIKIGELLLKFFFSVRISGQQKKSGCKVRLQKKGDFFRFRTTAADISQGHPGSCCFSDATADDDNDDRLFFAKRSPFSPNLE